MKRVAVLLVVLFLAGCGAAPTSYAATPAESPRTAAPESLAAPTEESAQTPAATFTFEPFVIQFTPVPSETPLPTLELPTEVRFPPALQFWDGLPTYLAESKPGFYFRLRFDPDVWALTADNFGFPALAHRAAAGCIMSPAAGRGLPLNVSVERDTRRIGSISFDISTAYSNGVKQFVNYAGGDANIYTAFVVAFIDQPDQCLKDAETVLATLASVPASQATPIPTP